MMRATIRYNFEKWRGIVAFLLGLTIAAALIASIVRSGHAGEKDRLPLIHFDTASFDLNDDARAALKENVSWLEKHADAVLVLEGHCDEWGDAGFNMQLGDRRARRVKAGLIEEGIDEDRLIMVVSHGEERPLDPHHTRDAWRMNRRVELIVR